MQQILNPVHHRRNSAGVKQIFHQILARRLHVDDARRAARDAVEILERQPDAQASGDGDQMNHGVGGSAQRHQNGDRIFESLARQDARRLQPGFDHLHRRSSAQLRDRHAPRIGRRNVGAARQRHAQRFGQAGHGGRRAHHRAMAGGARDAAFDLAPFFFRDAAGAVLIEQLPAIGAGAEPLPAPLSRQHGAARHHDGGNIRAGRAHQLRGRGLVAAAQQHHAHPADWRGWIPPRPSP